MKSYHTLKQIELDWDLVEQDLQKYQNNEDLTGSTVDADLAYHQSFKDNHNELNNLYKKYGYSKHNTKIWKSTNCKIPLQFQWQQNLLDSLPLDNAIVTLTRQDPGQVLPWHRDRYFMLKRLFPDDDRMIIRILVFMQNWKMGHVLQFHNDMLYNWSRGQVVTWHPNTYHLSANVGLEKKWTCNVTGFLKDQYVENLLKEMEIEEYGQTL